MDDEVGAKEFIEAQFIQNGVRYRTLGNDFSVYCPFWPHENNKMLLQVRFDGEKIHCWSCHASGSYNKLAERLGLQKLPPSANTGFNVVETAVSDAYLERGLPALPHGLKDFDEPYRGLDPEFLARFRSQKWWDLESSVWRILWPLTYNGKLQGYTAGRLDGETMPKYRHGPKGVVRTSRVLWPIDDPEIRDVVVLTEGPFSALRLLAAGIPAMATLGAQNWHSAKIMMMKQRRHPIRGIIIAFDADSAGESGTERVKTDVCDAFEEVELFDCPLRKVRIDDPENPGQKIVKLDANGDPELTGTDPGDMPASYVEKLRLMVVAMEQRLQDAKIKKSKRKRKPQAPQARA